MTGVQTCALPIWWGGAGGGAGGEEGEKRDGDMIDSTLLEFGFSELSERW